MNRRSAPPRSAQPAARSAAAANGATVGYEADLWRMADAFRGSMDAAEYRHVVLGLIFLKYISDAFEAQHARLQTDRYRKQLPRQGNALLERVGLARNLYAERRRTAEAERRVRERSEQ